MSWLKNKINFKIYLPLSLATIGIVEVFFARSQDEALFFLAVFTGSVINHLLMIAGLKVVFDLQDKKPETKDILKAGILMLGKTFILGIAFYIAIQVIKDRIILALFIYFIQLINLLLSLRKMTFSS